MSRASPCAVWAAVGAAFALTACQTLCAKKEPPPRAPVPTTPAVIIRPPTSTSAKSCVPKAVAPSPRYPDTDAALRAAPGAADRYQLMAAGRILRQQRLEELEKVVAGCR